MNSWLFFSLAAPFLWGIANVMDAVVRRKFVQNDLAVTWFIGITRLPLIPLFWWWGGGPLPPAPILLGMIVTGILWLLPFWLYIKAIHFEEPSRIALFLQLGPLFVLGAARILLGETLNSVQGQAFLVLLIGGFLAAFHYTQGRWRFSRAFTLMILATILWAISDVTFKKYAAGFTDFSMALSVYFMGIFLFSLLVLLFSSHRSTIFKTFSALSPRGWFFLSLNQIPGILGTLALTYALTLGKASLTTVLQGIQPLSAFLFGLLLAPFIPEVQPEDRDWRSLALKGASFGLIVVGLWMLA